MKSIHDGLAIVDNPYIYEDHQRFTVKVGVYLAMFHFVPKTIKVLKRLDYHGLEKMIESALYHNNIPYSISICQSMMSFDCCKEEITQVSQVLIGHDVSAEDYKLEILLM
jgi:hypothetical protein